MTLTAMDNYMYTSYQKRRSPKGIISVTTDNLESMKSFWKSVDEKMERDPHYIPKIGIESKKDIFAESNLLKFNNLAAVIAIPDLLTPGIKDTTCKSPMKTADFRVKCLSILLSDLNLSLT
mgnify:CR=1 FL=1